MNRAILRGTMIGATLTLLHVGTTWASAGVQMRPSDSFDSPLLQIELKVRTSQGETLAPGKYAPEGGDPHRTFESLGFGPSSTPQIRPSAGGSVEIVLQSGRARIDARLDAAR